MKPTGLNPTETEFCCMGQNRHPIWKPPATYGFLGTGDVVTPKLRKVVIVDMRQVPKA